MENAVSSPPSPPSAIERRLRLMLSVFNVKTESRESTQDSTRS